MNDARALEIVREVHASRPQPIDETGIDALDLLIEIEGAQKNIKGAREAVNDVAEQLPSGHADILAAEIYIAAGNAEAAKRSAIEATESIAPGTDLKVSSRIAFLLAYLKLDEKAFAYLKAISPPDCVGLLTQQLLVCAYKCGEKEFIKTFCEGLRDNGYVDAWCLQVELQVYEDLGATTELIQALQGSLAVSPPPANASTLRLWLSIAGLRLGRAELIERDVANLPPATEVDPRTGAMVVELLRRSTQSDEALDYAYTLFRRHPSAEIAHQSIISVAMWSHDLDRTAPDTVAPGVAVEIADKQDDSTYWRILEDESAPRPDIHRYELPSDDALAVALIGAKPGENVAFDTGSGQLRSLHIRALADKKRYRAFECLRQFEQHFPASGFIRSIKVIDEATGEADLSEMIKIMKVQEEHADSVLEVYQDHFACPVYLAANHAGDSLPGFLERCMTKGLRVRCCRGSEEERQRALAALRVGLGTVVDPSALLTLFLSDGLPILKSAKQPIVVSEGSYIWLRELREELFGEQSSRLRIGLHNGELYSQEWSKEATEKAAADLDGMLKLLESEVESGFVLARYPKLETESLRDALGIQAAQSIALAADRGYLLWTDDFATGLLARDEFEVERVWTQVVASDALVRGAIETHQFSELSLRLMQRRYWFTSLNFQTIQYALDKADYDPDSWPANVIWEAIGDADFPLPFLETLLGHLIGQMHQRDGIESVLMRVLHKLRGRPGGDKLLGDLRNERLPMLCGLDVIAQFRVGELIDSVLAASRSKVVLPSPIDIFRYGRDLSGPEPLA